MEWREGDHCCRDDNRDGRSSRGAEGLNMSTSDGTRRTTAVGEERLLTTAA